MPSRPEIMMVRRALILSATVWVASLGLSFAWFLGSTVPARAQDLDEGKSAAQLFSSNCAVCHKSVKELSKSAQGGSLQGFLRQHYTTGTDMAKMLAGYVNGNGGSASRETREAVRPAAPLVPRTVELPPRRPDAEIGEGEPRRSAAVAPADSKPANPKPDRARPGTGKTDGGKPEPAAAAGEGALPLAADLAPARASAAPNAAIAQARPIEAAPANEPPMGAGPADSKPADSKPDGAKSADDKPAEARPAP